MSFVLYSFGAVTQTVKKKTTCNFVVVVVVVVDDQCLSRRGQPDTYRHHRGTSASRDSVKARAGPNVLGQILCCSPQRRNSLLPFGCALVSLHVPLIFSLEPTRSKCASSEAPGSAAERIRVQSKLKWVTPEGMRLGRQVGLPCFHPAQLLALKMHSQKQRPNCVLA